MTGQRGGPIRSRNWSALALAMCAGLLFPLHPASADSSAVVSATFVMARWDTAAVAIGPVAYIYQGYTPPSETAGAFAYTPEDGELNQVTDVYPGSRQGASAATDGVQAWTFGGEVLADYKKDIIAHRPGSGEGFTTLSAQLPTGRSWTSAAWAASAAYVFGGQEPDGDILDDVLKFDPDSSAVSIVGHLPVGVMGSAAAAALGDVYLFGGIRDGGSYSDDVLRFDPDTNAVTIMSARLPSGRDGVSAATDGGRYVYLFGGCATTSCNLKQILRYDAAKDRVDVMDAELTTGRGRTSAVFIAGAALVFAGQQGANTALQQVVRYLPDPPNLRPTAHFELTVTGLHVSVNGASSTDSEGAIASYSWDWGDNSPTDSGLTAAHTYATGGAKTLKLTVTDGDGDLASVAASITLSTSTQSSGGGGPVVIWFPSTPGSNATNPQPSATASKSSTASVVASETPEISRVDPLASRGASPGAGLGALLAAAAVGFLLRRR